MATLRKYLTRLLVLSPFKIGLILTLFVLTLHPHFYYTWSTRSINQLIEGMDDRIHDFMFILRGPEMKHEPSATIVDIDEKSLKELGQWPWPRTVLATLIRQLDSAGPRAVGFDVVFSESDRTSLKHKIPELIALSGRTVTPPQDYDAEGWLRDSPEVDAEYQQVFQTLLARSGEPLPSIPFDNDRELAQAIRECKTVVLGYFWQTADDGLKDPENPASPIGSSFVRQTLPGFTFVSPFKRFAEIPYRPILNLEMLEEAADDRAGCFNAAFLAAGTVRRVPLLWEYMDNIYPTLSLQMLRVATKEEQGIVRFDDFGVDRVELPASKISIKTDRVAQLYVNFRGKQKSFPYLSAVDVVRGSYDRDKVRDKFIFIGSSAGGLMDLRSIAFEQSYPGVEVHANVIDNILHQDYLTQPRDGFAIELALILALGLLTSGLLAWTKPLVGLPITAVLVGGIFASNYILMFTFHLMLNLTFALGAVVAVLVVVPTMNFFIEGRQKRFIKQAFGTYLSPELVEEMTRSPELLSLSGQEKELTILFSDIRNFTTISESLPARELSTFLNEYLTPMTEIVMATRGTLDKFIGDAIMAFWGAPVSLPDHPQQAARAALEMLRVLRTRQPEWKARGLPLIDIGIGINTGRVSVGNMGSNTRFDYTVMGDSVNLASRLEGQNKNYGTHIMTSASTRALLGDEFFCRRLDFIRVKGKTEGVWVYEILCEGLPSPELKEEVDAFEEVLVHYQAQRFQEALDRLNTITPDQASALYALYRERIREYLKNPPPAEWDGIYTLTSK